MNLTVDGDRVRFSQQMAGNDVLGFEVDRLREEHTGVHGKLKIILNTMVLASTILNIEKDDQRAKIANSAWEFQFGSWRADGDWVHPDGQPFQRRDLKHQLDQFCGKAWQALVDSYSGQMVEYEHTAEPPPLKYLLDPYLLDRGGTIVFAAGGSGKSMLAQAWAISIASDLAHVWAVRKAPVLYINLERPEHTMERRDYYAAAAMGLPSNRSRVTYLHMRGMGLKAALQHASPWLKAHPGAFVVLDSVSRAGLGSLNDDEPATQFIDMMGSLGATWLGIGHTAKASSDHIFGSTHYENGADIAIKLSSEERTTDTGASLGVSLQITKLNEGRKPSPAHYAFEWNGTGNLSNIRSASEFEFPDLFLERKTGRVERVVDYLKAVGSATLTEIAENTGVDVSTISRLLNKPDGGFVRLIEKREGAYLYGLRAHSDEGESPSSSPF